MVQASGTDPDKLYRAVAQEEKCCQNVDLGGFPQKATPSAMVKLPFRYEANRKAFEASRALADPQQSEAWLPYRRNDQADFDCSGRQAIELSSKQPFSAWVGQMTDNVHVHQFRGPAIQGGSWTRDQSVSSPRWGINERGLSFLMLSSSSIDVHLSSSRNLCGIRLQMTGILAGDPRFVKARKLAVVSGAQSFLQAFDFSPLPLFGGLYDTHLDAYRALTPCPILHGCSQPVIGKKPAFRQTAYKVKRPDSGARFLSFRLSPPYTNNLPPLLPYLYPRTFLAFDHQTLLGAHSIPTIRTAAVHSRPPSRRLHSRLNDKPLLDHDIH